MSVKRVNVETDKIMHIVLNEKNLQFYLTFMYNNGSAGVVKFQIFFIS